MADTPAHLYALALGSNRPLSGKLTPARLLDEVAARIGQVTSVLAQSSTIQTAPIGPSLRRYANAALLVESSLAPPAMLDALQGIERDLGRKRFRRWGARSIDIDIILWSGGRWNNRALTIPHAAFRNRAFVLTPLLNIAADWRDPWSGLTVRHLATRLAARPVKAVSRG